MEARIHNAADQHADLLDKIAQTAHALPALAEQSRLLADLTSQLDASQSRLRTLDTRRAAELKDVEKYRDSSARRFLHRAVGRSAEYDERAAKEEAEYHDVLAQVQHEQAVAATLRQRIDEVAVVKEDLEIQVQLYRGTQRELDELYADVFAGMPKGRFPNVDEKASASDRALLRYHETRDNMDTLEKVLQLLTEVIAKAPVAHKNMNLALDHSNGMCLWEANQTITEVEKLVQNAQSLSTVVGPVPKIRRTQMFQSHSYDAVSAVLFHDEVRIAQKGLKDVVTAVEGFQQEIKARIESFGPELRIKEDELEQTTLELQKERRLVFDQILRGQKS